MDSRTRGSSPEKAPWSLTSECQQGLGRRRTGGSRVQLVPAPGPCRKQVRAMGTATSRGPHPTRP